MKKYYLLMVLQVLFLSGFAQQGPTCDQIQAFCLGTEGLTLPNSNNYNFPQRDAEIGPSYGCAIPFYPTWLLIQIDTPGDLEFYLSQTSEMDGSGDILDADFVLWGPFNQGADVCDYTASLNANNIQGCDPSLADVVPINIDDAEVGKLYVLMVTNYSGEIGFINIQQNSSAPNAGTTACTIEQPDLGPDQEICNNEVIILDSMTTDADNYIWEVDNGNGFTVINGENNPTITVTDSGIYRVIAVGPNGEQLEDEVEVIYSMPAEINDPYFESVDNFFCVDSSGEAINTVAIGEDLGPQYTYDWTPDNDVDGDGVEEAIFEVEQAGTYELVVTSPNSTCSSSVYIANFIPSGPPATVIVEIDGESFSDSSMYTATVTAEGGFSEFEYEYSLDDADGPFQSSNVFSNLTPGSHQIFVRDINECGITASEIFNILDYPKYFTPNGDGIHETWNISALDTDLNANAQIYIFDRYGKLLKQLSPRGQGWNGFFNGRPMPSDTYWFRVEYKEPTDESLQEFKSYFLLKR